MAAISRTESKRTVSAVKEGWVDKKGPKSYCSFRRRYIILWSSKRIEYYTDDTLEKLKGVIDLRHLHRRFVQRSDKVPKSKKKKNKKSKPAKKISFHIKRRNSSTSTTDDDKNNDVDSHYGFKIITDKRTWYLSVNDSNLRDEWIQTIRNTIDELPATTTTTTASTQPLSLQSAAHSSTLQNTVVHDQQQQQPMSLKSTIHKLQSQNNPKWNQLLHAQRIHNNQQQTNVNKSDPNRLPAECNQYDIHDRSPIDTNTEYAPFPDPHHDQEQQKPDAKGNNLCNQSTENAAYFAQQQDDLDDDTSSLLHESDTEPEPSSSSAYETEPGEAIPRIFNAENIPPNQSQHVHVDHDQEDEHKQKDESAEVEHRPIYIERINANTPSHETHTEHEDVHETQSHVVSPGACNDHTSHHFDYHHHEEELAEPEGSGSNLGCSLSTTPRLSPLNSPNNVPQSSMLHQHKSESYSEWTDFWDLETAKRSKYIELSDTVLNGIHCTKSKSTEWVSCFGSKHVQMSNNKCESEQQWKLRILARTERSNQVEKGQIANIVVGVAEVGLVKHANLRSNRFGGFWMQPKCAGYGFAGYSGKKLDGNKRNQAYGRKYRVGDVVTIQLQSNGALSFKCNERDYGVAFKVDVKKEYVLAVAFCNDLYDVQIFD